MSDVQLCPCQRFSHCAQDRRNKGCLVKASLSAYVALEAIAQQLIRVIACSVQRVRGERLVHGAGTARTRQNSLANSPAHKHDERVNRSTDFVAKYAIVTWF